MNITIRLETPDDYRAVEELTREAFWDESTSGGRIVDEHLLTHNLRKHPAFIPELDTVAELEGNLAGHIIYSKGKIIDDGGGEHEALTFGPLAVLPKYQLRGVGRALLLHTIAEARRLGYRAIFLYGHPDYYPRMGFRRAADLGISTQEGKTYDAFMGIELYPGALDGITGRFHLPAPYNELTEKDAIAFDSSFPLKEPAPIAGIDLLLDRLDPAARAAVESLDVKFLAGMSAVSERRISALPGIDGRALDVICSFMREHGRAWGEGSSQKPGQALFDKVVLDCLDSEALSAFYCKLLGWNVGYRFDDGNCNIIIIASPDCNANIGFQRDPDYTPPVWPAEPETPQQMMHLDIAVPKELHHAWVRYAVSLGAKVAHPQYTDMGTVMLDPEGHPFCIDLMF